MKFWREKRIAFLSEKSLQVELLRNRQQVIYFYDSKCFHFFQGGASEFEMTVEEHNELMSAIKAGLDF